MQHKGLGSDAPLEPHPANQLKLFSAFTVDLPAADESKGLAAYADAVVDAVGDRPQVTVVAQSLGAFTAPFVWQRVPTRQVVFVNTMIPVPGETPGAWWDDVGWEQARVAAAVVEPGATGPRAGPRPLPEPNPPATQGFRLLPSRLRLMSQLIR